jgi:hypothetical protein
MKTTSLKQSWPPLTMLGLLLVALPLAALAQTAAPSTETLERLAKEAYAKFKNDTSGKNADYIPALAKVPSNLFGIYGEGVGGMGNDTSFLNSDAAFRTSGSLEALPYWSGMPAYITK